MARCEVVDECVGGCLVGRLLVGKSCDVGESLGNDREFVGGCGELVDACGARCDECYLVDDAGYGIVDVGYHRVDIDDGMSADKGFRGYRVFKAYRVFSWLRRSDDGGSGWYRSLAGENA